jgi:RimJ/RimL family protein N-acetyltransferase
MIAQFEHGAILQPIFVALPYRRYGIATRLLLSSAKRLIEQGCAELHSRCNLGNEASMAWHAKCGFVEVPEEWPAGHRANIYSMEAERQERLKLPTAIETRALAEFWRNERDRLKRY